MMNNRMKDDKWARLLAYVTGLVNQELLLRNEYLTAENRILRAHLPPRVRLSDPERSTLAEIGKRLGRNLLKDVACVAKPDTILAVSPAYSIEVRRIEIPIVSRSASDQPRGYRIDYQTGQRELRLGL